MNRWLRILFVLIIVRPVIFLLLGVNLRGREKLPKRGPAILIANHNSHLDTAVLMSLFSIGDLDGVHPVAAADYWLKNRAIAWFATKIVGVIPIRRSKTQGKDENPLAPISEALARDQIIVFYPEGTRGEPERMSHFKFGILRLAERHPTVPIVPIFLHGTGKSLPRGEGLLVPFCCNVWVGDPIFWNGDKETFLPYLEAKVAALAEQAHCPAWD